MMFTKLVMLPKLLQNNHRQVYAFITMTSTLNSTRILSYNIVDKISTVRVSRQLDSHVEDW